MQQNSWNSKEKGYELKSKLIEWRHHLHKYPELSFQEKITSTFVLEQLIAMKVFHIETGIAKHGIVATLSSGDGPVIALRADMDALPIQEEAEVTCKSVHSNVMHACGHDAHMAILLGVAEVLAEEWEEERFYGTVKLIFQPAEEDADEFGLTGAPYFLTSGILDDVEKVIALHVCPWRKTGEIQINHGPSMANIDNFTLILKGEGAHGGYPHQGKDPIWISTFIMQALYSLIGRKMNPLEVGAISIGEIHGGSSYNVIPEKVVLKGTMRSFTPQIRMQLKKEVEQIAKIAYSLGGDFELIIEHGEPALNNHPGITEIIKKSAKNISPNIAVYEEAFGMGGEDFGYFTEKIPGAMFFLGCGFDRGEEKVLHSPTFQLNDEALPIGVAILLESTRKLLNREGNMGEE
ncbi:M20 family metallopeptidase [Evansella sp. AB-rgal1]|uniref:M20 metallopeptidase family protein n=1 Tax=Evansella sp. AB-rgal1 TaxID=3242696 RepID=UPI00359E9693